MIAFFTVTILWIIVTILWIIFYQTLLSLKSVSHEKRKDIEKRARAWARVREILKRLFEKIQTRGLRPPSLPRGLPPRTAPPMAAHKERPGQARPQFERNPKPLKAPLTVEITRFSPLVTYSLRASSIPDDTAGRSKRKNSGAATAVNPPEGFFASPTQNTSRRSGMQRGVEFTLPANSARLWPSTQGLRSGLPQGRSPVA